ncbi:MAG: hypothetical protein ACR2GR_09950 [Rhodothermales bacterium]
MNRLFFGLAIGFAVLAAPVQAQTSDDYFHGAGQEYIGDALDDALATVDEGLQTYPDDGKLQALKEKLEEEQENQKQQSESGEEDKGEEGEDQEPQGEENESEEEPEQDQEGESEQDEPQSGEQEQQSEDDPEQSGAQDEQPQPAPQDPTELSQEQAERILQALGDEEEQLLRQVQKLPASPRTVKKDW